MIASTGASAIDKLDALEQALRAERESLLSNDVDALLQTNQQKLAALQALEANPPAPSLHSRVVALSEFNRANGALLARRRREVDWALKHLGRSEVEHGYNASGHTQAVIVGRPLASA